MLTKYKGDQFLKTLENIEVGSVQLTTPEGVTRHFEGHKPGPHANLNVYDWRVVSNLATKGNVGFAEDYRDGLWETDNLESLLSVGIDNKKALESYILGGPLARIKEMLTYLIRRNSLKGSKKNIHAHYDLGNDFYKLWLDQGMTYSSALYNRTDDLVSAQDAKYDRMIEGLSSKSGSMLEIGCGWGGMAERALVSGDFDIKGLTLSEEQHAYANARLDGQANIALEDYRIQDTKYDHIVSIEMFEAVGEAYWNTYFNKVSELLKKGGKAMIQTITIRDEDFEEYRSNTDFIRSYIFPGGMLPSITKFKDAASKAGLKIDDAFAFGHDYARTLQEWLDNFDAQKNTILDQGFDEPFIRLWRFYLAGCAAGFRTGQTDVYQLQLSHAD